MGKSLFTRCISASVLGDIRKSFAADVEVKAELGRVESLPEAMVESFLTCATVDEVASCGSHGGVGSQGRAWARQKRYPRSSSASSEAEFCTRGSVYPSVVLDVPSGDGRRRARTVAYVQPCCWAWTRPWSCCHCTPVALCRVGMCIECGCPPLVFGRALSLLKGKCALGIFL
jgi:hypothetical protein